LTRPIIDEVWDWYRSVLHADTFDEKALPSVPRRIELEFQEPLHSLPFGESADLIRELLSKAPSDDPALVETVLNCELGEWVNILLAAHQQKGIRLLGKLMRDEQNGDLLRQIAIIEQYPRAARELLDDRGGTSR
jgi:hypothetical protein